MITRAEKIAKAKGYREDTLRKNPDDWLNDVFDYYFENRWKGIDLDEMPIVKNYIYRHRIDIRAALYEIGIPREMENALVMSDEVQKMFLVYQMKMTPNNPNIKEITLEFYKYIVDNIDLLETDEFFVRQYDVYHGWHFYNYL